MLNTNLQSSVAKSIEASKSLPIAKHKDNIMSTLEKNRVLIISGDTGCGKTTQVPKFILENSLAQNKEVKIICT
jgi:ATP-dependent RNA helicase DHX29